jgi:hypothetical protein
MVDITKIRKATNAEFMRAVVQGDAECPNGDNHTECPGGYTDWHEWAARMHKTHTQRKCPGCGLYRIWVKRKPRK